jgi:hypothetical protein
LGIIDGKPWSGLNHEELALIEAMKGHASPEVIKLLIEKTDVDLINNFIDRDGHEAAFQISLSLLQYDMEITELAIKKGVDFSRVINLLIFEFGKQSLLYHVKSTYLFTSSFHSDEEYPILFDRIKVLLKSGVGYNCYSIYSNKTTLQMAEQIYYVHKLLSSVLEFHEPIVDKTVSPRDTILKLIIGCTSLSSGFRGYQFKKESKRSQICLVPFFQEKSLSIGKIKLLPEPLGEDKNMAKLIYESPDLIENILEELRWYVSDANEEMEEFKIYPVSRFNDHILDDYEEMLKYGKFADMESKIYDFEALSPFVKVLLVRVLKLYIIQKYEIDKSVKEVSKEVLKLKKIINTCEDSTPDKLYETEEVLDILDLQNIDINEKLEGLISKLSECDGVDALIEFWKNLDCFGPEGMVT